MFVNNLNTAQRFQVMNPVLETLTGQEVVITLWSICGASVIVVCGIMLLVVWEAKTSNFQEQEDARKNSQLEEVTISKSADGINITVNKVDADNLWKRRGSCEDEAGADDGGETSVYVIPVPPPKSDDDDDEVFLETEIQNLKMLEKSRCSLTELYIRTNKSHSEGCIGVSTKKGREFRMSHDINSNDLTMRQ